MSDYKKKIREARLIAAKKPPVDKATLITNVVSKDELQELYMQFNSIYDQVRISLDTLEKNTTESNKQTTEKMVEINNTVVDLMGKVLNKGLSIDNVEDIKKAIESSGVKITNIDDLKQTVKVELPEGDNKLEEVSKNLANIADQLGSLEPVKQGQRPEDFVPFRRVIRTGKRLEFDDTSWSGARGGGGSTSPGSSSSTKATAEYSIVAISNDGTYKYFFFEKDDLAYYIMRKNLSTNVFDYTKGTGGYATVYQSAILGPSGSPIWASYGNTF